MLKKWMSLQRLFVLIISVIFCSLGFYLDNMCVYWQIIRICDCGSEKQHSYCGRYCSNETVNCKSRVTWHFKQDCHVCGCVIFILFYAFLINHLSHRQLHNNVKYLHNCTQLWWLSICSWVQLKLNTSEGGLLVPKNV